VVRASSQMSPNDNFRVGIVSWGPNTPTAPDPDTWIGLNGAERNDYAKFEEFPWGSRGVGFISFFGTPQNRYFMDGATAKVKADNSGYNWVRSHTTKKRRSGVIKGITRPVNVNSIVIESASITQLPPQILPDEDFKVVINGKNFGANPNVVLSGYDVEVTGSNATAIDLKLSTPPGKVPQEPIVLIVTNTQTKESQSRSDLFTLQQVNNNGPRITGINPARGNKDVGVITLTGQRFETAEKLRVLFGDTVVKVLSVAGDGSSASVELPSGGLPSEGARNVTVQNMSGTGTVSGQDTMINGFYYENSVTRPKLFLFCAPGGPAGESSAGDWAMVLLTLSALTGLALRRRSMQ
jgi:hypothetical protein